MTESAEKRKELEIVRKYLMEVVRTLDHLIVKHAHVWSEEEILSLGWVYDSYYPAGNEDMYVKNKKIIRVPKDKTFSYILTYEGKPMRQIMDNQELEEYANS